SATPLATMPVGVLVERSKSASQWIDFHWRPIGVLTAVPDASPWTKLSDDGERATFYVGAADVELFRTETANYRDNLNTEAPLVWIVLRPVERDPPYELALVTADPAEGEAMTEAGGNVVEAVAMPKSMRESIAAFVAEHHVEQEFVKRKRDRANPEALARRGPLAGGGRKGTTKNNSSAVGPRPSARPLTLRSRKNPIRRKPSIRRTRRPGWVRKYRPDHRPRNLMSAVCHRSNRLVLALTSPRLCSVVYQALYGMRPFAAPGRPIRRSATLWA